MVYGIGFLTDVVEVILSITLTNTFYLILIEDYLKKIEKKLDEKGTQNDA